MLNALNEESFIDGQRNYIIPEAIGSTIFL